MCDRLFMKLEHVLINLEKLNSAYSVGEPASVEQIAEAEQRLNIQIPAQIRMFYQHFNGLSVENPPFQILSLSQFNFISPNLLHFSTFDSHHKVCFDTSRLNEAEQWLIVFADNKYEITFTMASFWSNKIWKWLGSRQPIWLD